MPAEWTTNEQKIFLLEELVTFKRIGGRRYTKQWSTLYHKWFERWSERSIVLPDLPEDAALTAKQKDDLKKAVNQRQGQLRRWMHWHAGAGQNRSANNKTARIINELLKPKTRTKKPWEIYSRMFFKARIQPEIGTGMSITDISKKIREMFENESHDIKEQIHNITKKQKQGAKCGRSKSKGAEGEEEFDFDESDLEVDDGPQKDPVTLRR